ncbi:MAG: hypothetical protein H8D34_00975, partial [Chloroflexi bacterium]|nr:hypothetical protein [Chloroflexota bacterium]
IRLLPYGRPGAALDSAYAASLSVNGDAGSDVVNFPNALPTLAGLAVDSESIMVDNGGFNTTGGQSYTGAVVLGADTTLTDTSDSGFHLIGTLDGAQNLVMDVAATTVFDGVVGGLTPLASLDSTSGGPFTATHNISTTGDISVTLPDTVGTDEDLTVNNSVTVQSAGGAITFNVGDDLNVQDGATVQANGTVTFNADPAAGDPDAFGATVAIAGTVLGSTVELNGGDDADTFNMQRTTAPTTLNAADGDDTFNIASDAPTNAGVLENIAAVLTVNGDAGNDTLNISDFGDATGDAAGTLTSTQLSGLGGSAIIYATVENLNIELGSGNDIFAVQSTSAITNAVISGNAGDDTFNVGSLTNSLDDILGTLTINGNTPSASDVLNINDLSDTDDNTYTLTDTTLNRTGMAQLTYGTFEELHLNAGVGADTIIISDTHAGSTTVNANDGADMVIVQTTSGTTTVNGQADADHIIVQTTGAGQTTTLNGDDGQDTFTVQATGLGSTTTLNGGDEADIFNVQTIAGVTTINAGAGNDTINLSSDAPANLGTLNGIAGLLTVNGDADADTLNVSDLGDTTDNTGALTSTQLTGLGMGVGLTYGSLELLNIDLGSGNDLFHIHSTHTPNITNLNAGPGNDTYLIYDGWGDIRVTETGGIDTFDFTPTDAALIFMIGGGVQVSDGLNTLEHQGNSVEHLSGGGGSDWFIMIGAGATLADGIGTISGGLGYDTISYEHYQRNDGGHQLYNGLGLAKPADVENVVMPPEEPAEENVLLELLGQFGDKSIDELIDLVNADSGTYQQGTLSSSIPVTGGQAQVIGSSIPLNIGLPTAISTPAGHLVVFSGGIGGVASVKDIPDSSLAIFDLIRPGMNYLAQNGRMGTFGSGAALIGGVTVNVTNGDGILSMLPSSETMAVIFQIPAHMVNEMMSIMWWDEARGMWREIDATMTPDGRIFVITRLTGTFVLVAK